MSFLQVAFMVIRLVFLRARSFRTKTLIALLFLPVPKETLVGINFILRLVFTVETEQLLTEGKFNPVTVKSIVLEFLERLIDFGPINTNSVLKAVIGVSANLHSNGLEGEQPFPQHRKLEAVALGQAVRPVAHIAEGVIGLDGGVEGVLEGLHVHVTKLGDELNELQVSKSSEALHVGIAG